MTNKWEKEKEIIVERYISELTDYVFKNSENKSNRLYAIALLAVGVTAARQVGLSDLEIINSIVGTMK